MPARARNVMEARAEILKAIEGYAISQGMSRAWGVAQFLDAQAAMVARQEIEARRDCGEILTDREIASLARPLLLKTGFMIDPERIVVANDRRGKPSVGRSALYDWFKTRDEKGVVALALARGRGITRSRLAANRPLPTARSSPAARSMPLAMC